MKKILGVLLALSLLLSIAYAETTVNPDENRNITINPAGDNPMIDGYSPVTGRKLDEIEAPDDALGQAVTGRYMPMLIQIDNTGGGVNSEAYGRRAPWGLDFVDVIYEAPLYFSGDTRLTFLYSDVIPTGAGPDRSARVFHAWLREEWDCGFIHYGQQEYTETNVPEIFAQTGATKKGVLFNGIVGLSKPWKKYFFDRGDTQMIKTAGTSLSQFAATPPHHVGVNVAAVSTLIPVEHQAANHTWLFSDELPTEGDEATIIRVTWGKNAAYNSELEWDEDEKQYYRFMSPESKSVSYADFDSGNPVTFSNIIVQFTTIEYPFSNAAPKPDVLGTGNADYFIGGRHIAGVWQRNQLSDRTVFYGANGNEITLNPGRTLIIVMDYKTHKGTDTGRSIRYE